MPDLKQQLIEELASQRMDAGEKTGPAVKAAQADVSALEAATPELQREAENAPKPKSKPKPSA